MTALKTYKNTLFRYPLFLEVLLILADRTVFVTHYMYLILTCNYTILYTSFTILFQYWVENEGG